MLNRLRAALAAIGFVALAWLAPAPAGATIVTTPTTLSNSAWSDLGPGPMFIGLASGWSAIYAIGDSAPSLVARGYPVPAAGQNVFTSSHVWALAVGSASSPPIVLTAPISVAAALNADGGALSHIMNWPSSWAVTGAFWPYTLNGDGGVPSHVTNFPAGQTTKSASVPTVGPSDPDYRPAAGAITVVDSATASVAGDNAINLITGAPTPNSFQSWAINGQSSAICTITGTWTGTLQFEGSGDSASYVAMTMRERGSSYGAAATTGNGIFQGDTSGLTNLRVRATAAMTGTASAQCAFSASSGPIQVQNPIRLFDNASNQQATIKPANTPPVATDPALVVALSPNGATGADGSGAITLGGTAQALFSGATPANGFAVYNSNLSDDCWVSLSTTAAANAVGSIRIAANGGGYETPPNMKPFHAVSIVCPTTGDAFTSIKW
jgi:hypothetical protein